MIKCGRCVFQIYFICMNVLLAYLSVHRHAWCVQRSEEGTLGTLDLELQLFSLHVGAGTSARATFNC